MLGHIFQSYSRSVKKTEVGLVGEGRKKKAWKPGKASKT